MGYTKGVADVIEAAASGRAKCRACGRAIAKGDLRFGERGPNPFGEGEVTYWFHLQCAAYKRPEPAAVALREIVDPFEGRDALLANAERGVAHPRLARFAGVQRSPSARAKCRHCHTPIAKDAWRIVLDFWEDGRFGGSGYLHVVCASAYFGTLQDLPDRLSWFAPDLDPADREAIVALAATS